MTPIVRPETKEAYKLCFLVRAGKLTESEAKKVLHSKFDMNKGSASDTLRNLSRMLDGRLYHRTLNLAVTQYFFDCIWQDLGHQTLLNAIKATQLHIEYRQALKTGGPMPSLRSLCDEYRTLADTLGAARIAASNFQERIEQSLSDSPKERARRLNHAQKTPKRRFVRSVAYARNPDVVAERLHRANGVCDGCCAPAPFKRFDGRPFLEVHHRIPLSEGGQDVLKNTLALCPNCHREAHFGAHWEKFRDINQ